MVVVIICICHTEGIYVVFPQCEFATVKLAGGDVFKLLLVSRAATMGDGQLYNLY